MRYSQNYLDMNLRFLLLAFCLAVPFVSEAQSPQDSESFHFSCVAWENLPFPELYYREGKVMLPIKLAPGNRSEIYRLQGETALELYVLKTDSQGEPNYEIVGRGTLLPETKRMLFLLSETKATNGLPLALFGLDDSLKTFPPGTFRFINFTPYNLKAVFGGSTTTLPPKEVQVVKSNISQSGGFLPFLVSNNAGDTVFETRLYAQPTGREMVFITPVSDRQASRVAVKFISQIITPPAPTNQ
jgi:hypothetical protein